MVKVGVSGIGGISCIGENIDEMFWRGVKGENGIKRVTRINGNFVGGEVVKSNEELEKIIKKKLLSRNLFLERGELLLFKALEEALEDSGIDESIIRSKRVGVIIGTSLSGFTKLEEEYVEFLSSGKRSAITAKALLVYPLNTVAQRIRYEYNLKGLELCISTACSSSLQAVGIGYYLVKEGIVDIAIVGGTDPLSLISLAGFSVLRSLAEGPCTPFSEGRIGLNVGEGAGVVILEREEEIRKRGAKVYGWIAGVGGTNDGYHPTASDPTGIPIRRCMESALRDIGVENEMIAIFAHGTGTLHNDMVEYRAISQVGKLKVRKITALKSLIGHTLGASGVIEFCLMCKCLKEKTILPISGFSVPRYGDRSEFVESGETKIEFSIGLKNSFAFGNNNVSVVIVDPNKEIIGKKVDEGKGSDKIVISGIGVVSCYDTYDKNSIINLILQGKSGIKDISPVRSFRSRRTSSKAAVVDIDLVERTLEKKRIKNIRKMDRISKISVLASLLSLEDARYRVSMSNTYNIGLIVGTATGGLESVRVFYESIVKNGIEAGDPGVFVNTVLNACAGWISLELGIRGYTSVVSQGTFSGISALWLGKKMIEWGVCESVLVGSISEYSTRYHEALLTIGVINDDQKIYDASSKGYILGEAAVFFFLEKESSARQRGSKIYGYLEDVHICSLPVFPNVYRYPIPTLQSSGFTEFDPRKIEEIEIIFGDGNGKGTVASLELSILSCILGEENLRDKKVTALTDYFGYVPGVNIFLNLMFWMCTEGTLPRVLSTTQVDEEGYVLVKERIRKKEKAMFFQVSEGGNWGYVINTLWR